MTGVALTQNGHSHSITQHKATGLNMPCFNAAIDLNMPWFDDCIEQWIGNDKRLPIAHTCTTRWLHACWPTINSSYNRNCVSHSHKCAIVMQGVMWPMATDLQWVLLANLHPTMLSERLPLLTPASTLVGSFTYKEPISAHNSKCDDSRTAEPQLWPTPPLLIAAVVDLHGGSEQMAITLPWQPQGPTQPCTANNIFHHPQLEVLND
jgi:hypothetical protein